MRGWVLGAAILLFLGGLGIRAGIAVNNTPCAKLDRRCDAFNRGDYHAGALELALVCSGAGEALRGRPLTETECRDHLRHTGPAQDRGPGQDR